MKILKKVALLGVISTSVFAGSVSCDKKLFSVTIDNRLTISDVIENIAESCEYSVIVKDEGARQRMNKKVYYLKIKNNTIRGFLNTVLKDSDLNYSLKNNKLKISYLTTKTFKVDYISGIRTGKSSATVTIANSQSSLAGQSGNTGGQEGAQNLPDGGQGSTSTKTGISIETNNEFKFWRTISDELNRILISAGDGGAYYEKTSDNGWTGADGRVWSHDPLKPIVNPEAGMITVTGTNDQLARVSKYLQSLTRQIKRQVLIDVKILGVVFNNSKTTGVDWNQIYKLQNFQVDSLLMSQKNVSGFLFDKNDGITETTFREGAKPKNGGVINITGSVAVDQIVKFLSTQGDVKAISSPRIMTLNNQPALISVGQEIFYKIKSTSSLGQNSSGTAEGEVVDSVFAGILLDITPQISKNGMVTLRINPSITDTVDDVSTEAIRSIPPDLRKRQISSVVTIKDGSHAILGGLITTSTGEIVTKVPLLGDMPLIEHAFKKTEKIEKVEELVFIITPHIIKNEKTLNLKDLGYTKL